MPHRDDGVGAILRLAYVTTMLTLPTAALAQPSPAPGQNRTPDAADADASPGVPPPPHAAIPPDAEADADKAATSASDADSESQPTLDDRTHPHVSPRVYDAGPDAASPEPPGIEDRGVVSSPGPSLAERRVLHGFRMGYLFLMNYDRPIDNDDPDCTDCSLKERYDIRSPHQFLLGYEMMGRLVGHDWLNVVLVGNVLVSGLEQSKFIPSANFLIGFEFNQSFQLGVGPNLSPQEGKEAHMVLAAGWTPRVGSFYVPVHAFFIPDVDDNHRIGLTTGVNW